ncbi:lysoplasmalogenase [Spirosoma agri]|uniref:Lysoplasmalogenase n=1 Tax=Spirosoma agri TaxID=1987381 RepID=A0A6M0IIV5_9BACT|nr:lysoplasmalogenase [Spirosoma agri]NEU66903.1 lysoplasmalogenase [Spirosoma agri]
MSARPTLPFTLVFVGSTVLEMIGDSLAIRFLHYGCKPLIMALLMLYVRQCIQSAGWSDYARWLLIGMVFALLGDVLLMIQEIDLFALGLASFLVMQLCYCRAFWLSMRRNRFSVRLTGLVVLGFVVYGALFLVLLRPEFVKNSALTVLWWPVVLYTFCLSLMGLLATQRQQLSGYAWVVAGALLFILSDSAIAIDKFLQPIPGSAWVIMSTYAAAQYLIAVGMMQQLTSDASLKIAT